MILPPKNTEQECLSYAFTYNVLNVYCKGSLYCSLHLYLTLLWCWMTDIEHNILTHHFSSLSICRSASLKYTGEWDGSFPISKSQKAIRKGLERKIRRKQHRNDWEKDTWTNQIMYVQHSCGSNSKWGSYLFCNIWNNTRNTCMLPSQHIASWLAMLHIPASTHYKCVLIRCFSYLCLYFPVKPQTKTTMRKLTFYTCHLTYFCKNVRHNFIGYF